MFVLCFSSSEKSKAMSPRNFLISLMKVSDISKVCLTLIRRELKADEPNPTIGPEFVYGSTAVFFSVKSVDRQTCTTRNTGLKYRSPGSIYLYLPGGSGSGFYSIEETVS